MPADRYNENDGGSVCFSCLEKRPGVIYAKYKAVHSAVETIKKGNKMSDITHHYTPLAWQDLHTERNCGSETNGCPICIANCIKRWAQHPVRSELSTQYNFQGQSSMTPHEYRDDTIKEIATNVYSTLAPGEESDESESYYKTGQSGTDWAYDIACRAMKIIEERYTLRPALDK